MPEIGPPLPHEEKTAPDAASIRRSLLDAILLADLTTARGILRKCEGVFGGETLVGALLEPVIEEVGKGWEMNQLSLAQGYVAAKVAGEVMERIAATKPPAPDPPPGEARIAVMGNIEDDFHALGRKMVVTFLKSAGWQVHDLGNDVPAHEFVECAADCGARVIGVSAMTYTTASNVGKVRANIVASGWQSKIRLAVGGAIFNMRPELVAEVGGDGTARNALAAPQLFERLWQRAGGAEGV